MLLFDINMKNTFRRCPSLTPYPEGVNTNLVASVVPFDDVKQSQLCEVDRQAGLCSVRHNDFARQDDFCAIAGGPWIDGPVAIDNDIEAEAFTAGHFHEGFIP